MATQPQDAAAAARSEQLLRDAEEALQKEKLQLFWRQWGSTIIGMAIMLVLGTGAGVAWREWRAERDESSTVHLIGAVGENGTPVTEAAARNMSAPHAAIAWLARTAAVENTDTPEGRKALEDLYRNAASAGDDAAWGLLARWNLLRLRMDDETADAAALLKEYETLARDMRGSALSALANTDAAVIAGERLQDPARALKYLAEAEKSVTGVNAMAVTIADLKHLYEIRAQKPAGQPVEKPVSPAPAKEAQ